MKQYLRHSLGIRGTFAHILLFLVLLLGSLPAVTGRAQGVGPALQVDVPQRVKVGEVVEITLSAKNIGDVAGYEANVLFDPQVAEFAGLHQRENDLRKFGRDVVPLAAIDLPTGVAVGLVSCPVNDCLDEKGPKQNQGGRGLVRLGTIDLLAHHAGLLEVRLDAIKVVDAAGNAVPLPASSQTFKITVGDRNAGTIHSAPSKGWSLAPTAASTTAPADVTGDGLVANIDVMEVAVEWTRLREQGNPCGTAIDATLDTNRDGCIDVADAQLVAAGLGTTSVTQQPSAKQLLPQNSASSTSLATIAAGVTFTVNSTGDGWDASVGNGVCKTSSGVCTLRAAIQEANKRTGADTIAFNIPGTGVQTINITQKMPSLYESSGTIINGYTQPGASPNTHLTVSNAVLMVQLKGTGPSGVDGIIITGPNNTVRGLSFYDFKRALWVYGTNANDNSIVGNFIGTNASSSFGAPSLVPNAYGVQIEQGADRNRLGGTSPAERNVISGNARHGATLYHEGTVDNVVFNNLIGMGPNGDRRLPNRGHGIDMNFGAARTIVGGTSAGERNIVSGNEGSGIEISHTAGTRQNRVIGNYVGTNVSGTGSPSWAYNYLTGISVKDRVVNNVITDNVVGNSWGGGITLDNYGECCVTGNQFARNRIGISLNGTAIPNKVYGVGIFANQNQIGPDNIIAYNPVGIQVDGDANDGNRLTQNSIFGNTGLGIDLTPLNATNPNDSGDADAGPNEQLNYPVLASATATEVTGTACANCRVEVFVADGGSGAYGEGRTFLGAGTVAQDGSFAVAVSGVGSGAYVTATAIDAAGNTSEFAKNLMVEGEQARIALPGRFEAEDYRNGGTGVGYYDTTAGNSGGALYRGDDVDIQQTSDSSGTYNIGWIAPGEWLAYDVTVAAGGNYIFTTRVATPNSGRSFFIEVDGVNVSGTITVPVTGSYNTWKDVASPPIAMSAGNHTVKLVSNSSGFNWNYVVVGAQ